MKQQEAQELKAQQDGGGEEKEAPSSADDARLH